MYTIKSNNDVEKISAVFCYDDTTEMGYYESYRNFCKKNMIYLAFVYGSEKVRVHSTPKEVLVSTSSSEKVRILANNKIAELEEVSEEEKKNLKKYIMVTYVDGQRKYFKYKEGFEELFKIYEPETGTKNFCVLGEPYLIFETKTDAIKAQIIESISEKIENKKFKEVLKAISDDCSFELLGTKFEGKKEIKREYKRRVGFFNKNLSKVRSIINLIEGTLDENKNSILEIYIKMTDKKYKHYSYVMHMEFNKTNKINMISITPYMWGRRRSRIMLKEDLVKIKRAAYNDFK